MRERPGFRYEMRELMEVLPVLTEPTAPVPQAVARAVGQVLGREASFICSPGTYDQKHIARIGHLQDCVAYGPGILDLAHQPDEFVVIDDLVASAKVMAMAALELLGCLSMIGPGPRNSLVDVAGLLAGNAESYRSVWGGHAGEIDDDPAARTLAQRREQCFCLCGDSGRAGTGHSAGPQGAGGSAGGGAACPDAARAARRLGRHPRHG